MNIEINTFEDTLYSIILQFQKGTKLEKKILVEWLKEGIDTLIENGFL